MDMHDLWNDDPESLFLDLGFGCDESDLSVRIPARFINFQSQANGMSLQVFLETQRNRLDLENPDVSCKSATVLSVISNNCVCTWLLNVSLTYKFLFTAALYYDCFSFQFFCCFVVFWIMLCCSSQGRFRQVEVFQQVTTAFLRAPQRSDLPPEALARRRQVGALFRRLARKSLSQTLHSNTQNTALPTAGSSPCGSPPCSLPSKILQEELTPDREEMIDCRCVVTEQTALKPLEEVFTVAESSVGVFILHDCRPHTLSPSSSSSSLTSPAHLNALLASPPPSLGCLLSVDCPPPPLRRLSSPDGNYLEIPALMSHDSSPSLAITSSSVRSAALIGGLKTANPSSPSPSVDPADSDGDAAFPKVPDSVSTLRPRTSFPALPEISSLSDSPYGNVSTSESEVMRRASEGNPASAAGCQESARPQSAASVAYYTITNFHYPSPSVLPPLNKPFPRQSAESTANEVLVESSDSRPPTTPAVYQSEVDLPDDITDPQKDSDLQNDMKQEGNWVNHNDVTQTANLNTKSHNSPSEASTFTSEEKPQLLTKSDKQSSTNAKLEEFGRICVSSDSVQKPHDLPDAPRRATPTQTPSGVWDVTEESSCDPDTDSWLDGPAGKGEGGGVLLSAVLEQTDTEGLVYWAEPIRVSVCSPVHDDLSGCEDPADTAHIASPPDVSSHSPRPQFVENDAALFSDTPSSFILNPLTFPSAVPSLKFSSCSLPSSHIAHRRDVPFATRSESTVLSGLFALDTSTPFRAVQSWTELQIQRHTATRAAHSTARKPHDGVHRRRGGDGVKVWRRRRQTAPAARDCVCGHQRTNGNQEGVSEKQQVGKISVRDSKLPARCLSSRLSRAPLCVSSTELPG